MFNFEIAIKTFVSGGIDYLINVPATGMTPIYNYFSEKSACIFACREEEAIAIAAGMSIGDKRPLVFVQQSGVGNMLNSFIGIPDGYDIYFPIIVLDRGFDDENPIQAHSSLRTIPIIETFEDPCILDFNDDSSIRLFADKVSERKRWFISKY